MSFFERLTEYVANQTSTYTPLNLPIPLSFSLEGSSESLSALFNDPRSFLNDPRGLLVSPFSSTPTIAGFVRHITTTPVHGTYYPILRFGALHAARVSLNWASMTRGGAGDRRQVGRLQDLFGYLTAAWGGGLVLSLLISQPPAWLISPTPWLVYVPIYSFLVPTGLARYMVETAPNFINLVGAYFDGVSRGINVTSIPTLLAAVPGQNELNVWTMCVLSAIATCSGGWIIQSFNLNAPKWSIGVPTILGGKGNLVLDTLEFWAAMVASITYCSLLNLSPTLAPITGIFARVVPDDLLTLSGTAVKATGVVGTAGLVDEDIARAITILVLGSLYCSKVITNLVLTLRSRRRVEALRLAKEKKDAESLDWMEMDDVKSGRGTGARGKGEAVKATGREGSSGQVKSRKKKNKA